MKLPSIFTGWEYEVEVLTRMFHRHNNRITPAEFDRLFPVFDYKRVNGGKWACRKMRVHFRTTSGPWFGLLYRNSPRHIYLDILQALVREGICTIEGKMPEIVYSFKHLSSPPENW